jgi:hypothetical protein
MAGRKLVTALGIALLLGSGTAGAVIVNIDATISGCTTCSGGPLNADVALGTVVTLIKPVQITLGPGTYTITNASTVNGVEPGATPSFQAWNFEAANPNGFAWSFLVATDNGNGTGTMLKADFVNAVFPTLSAAASATGVQTFSYSTLLSGTSTAGFVDTLTLGKTTTLDFFSDDNFLSDNSNGVALDIEATPEPDTALLVGTGLAGLVAATARRQQRRLRTQHQRAMKVDGAPRSERE